MVLVEDAKFYLFIYLFIYLEGRLFNKKQAFIFFHSHDLTESNYQASIAT